MALSHSPGERFCLMSPNQEKVYAFPSDDGYTNRHLVLELYPDGSYGPHEYSILPQLWDPTRPHLPWIPRDARAVDHSDVDVLWRPFTQNDCVPLRAGSKFYRISDRFERELQAALKPLREFTEVNHNNQAPAFITSRNACDFARHSVIHLRHADGNEISTLVDLVRGAKRNILECMGHLLYHRFNTTPSTIDHAYKDHVYVARDVVGVFTYDIEVTRHHVANRVPVWRIAEVERLPPEIKICARVELMRPVVPSGPRKLIAHVYGGELYIGKLVAASPSQGLYVPIGTTGLFKFAGSVNTAGELTSVAEEMRGEGAPEARMRDSTEGGPARTYPSVCYTIIPC